MQKVVVASRRQPHELLFLFMSILLGINYLLVTIPAPTSLVALAPVWVVKVWAGAFLLSGVVGCVGASMRRPVDLALELERGAMYISSAALLLFASAILTAGFRLSFGLGIILAWMVSNIWRAIQLHKELRALERQVSPDGGS